MWNPHESADVNKKFTNVEKEKILIDKADEYIAKAPTLTIFDGLVKAKAF